VGIAAQVETERLIGGFDDANAGRRDDVRRVNRRTIARVDVKRALEQRQAVLLLQGAMLFLTFLERWGRGHLSAPELGVDWLV